MNVLKIINDSEGNNIINILYMNNIKISENPSKKILSKYTKNNFFSLTEISDSDNTNQFYDYEDFSYLLDYQEIYIGKEVFLFDKIGIVSEIKSSFREEGYYDFCTWSEDNIPSLTKVKYVSHKIVLFKIANNTINTYYVWEDYNYQQSYLYNKYHSYQL